VRIQALPHRRTALLFTQHRIATVESTASCIRRIGGHSRSKAILVQLTTVGFGAQYCCGSTPLSDQRKKPACALLAVVALPSWQT